MGTYLITGATGGIGGATAELLRDRGHELILTGRSPERLAAVQQRLSGGAHARTQEIRQVNSDHASGSGARTATDTRVTTLPLDLAAPRRLEAALAVAGLPARLDGLVYAAGVAHLDKVVDTETDEWIEHLSVNLVSAAELTRLLLPALRAARGQIVYVNSTAGLRANPRWAAYAASKWGLRALADSVRAEEPEIRVTSFFPGRTATEMQRRVRAQEGASYDPSEFASPESMARTVVAALETPRDAEVTEITVRPRP
ncbi:SDR family oxidoreductase [Actinomadura rupiterrae]|uniref:SDR family oxidoreductase n=1 Tax=Actinomadura rupiterrae TaxID=559627 RepID=UPI0020A3B5FC|nr:SDR family oxidoreductase [Actinomadura rupiterrae]MCP2337722.1 short-subunit dehydrogenase [Actinomadura rupiterrae]